MEEQKRNKVSIINEDILSDKNLTPAEKMVYSRICYFIEFFESAEATAEYLGLKVWTIQSAKRKLEKLGYIVCAENTGRGKRYVADVNLGIYNKGRVCLEQSQSLVKTKSDVGENKVRVCLEQSQTLEKPKSCIEEKTGVLGKNVGKNVGEKVGESESKVGSKGRKVFRKPSAEEVKAYCKERGNSIDPEAFVDFYESKGWVVGKSPMKNWKAAVRTWERNGFGTNRVSQSGVVYQPKDGEDITYQRMFEKWKEFLGTSVKQTESEAMACKDLLDDLGEEWVVKLIVALRMRSETRFVTREIGAVGDFVSLAENRSLVMSFYNAHWKEWQRKQEEARTGKKPWELI